MEEKMVLDFFPHSTLKGSQFYFYCPNMNQKDKISISKLIKDYEGVVSFTINPDTIIIVETETIITSKNFLRMINNFSDIHLAYNNHIEIIKHNNNIKNKAIKVITYKELILELSSFENKSLNFFFDHGLNKNTNQVSNITLILTTMRNKTKLETYDFSYKDSNKKIIYDVPYYHKEVPEGFSVFCTDEEFELVMSYIKKKENNFQKNKIKEKEKLKEINLMSEPEPSKKNFICQLCRSRFDNYKEHILSETHCKNIKKHKNTFNKLTITFKRIVKSHSCDKNNFVYSTPKKELNLKEVKSKENSYTKSLSSLLTNESNNLIEFSPEDFKKEKKYNLRIKKSPSFGKDNNDNFYYFTSSAKNTNVKFIKQEKEINSPQQQILSTASSNFKNIFNEEIWELNKSKVKLNTKRKRDESKERVNYIGNNNRNLFERSNSRNKKIKK